ncbi:MAG: hypothetical protein J0H41_03345 [Rhizobiales bacterium]|nr:hypothetical protein [Hyphomicrobiales bacterium]
MRSALASAIAFAALTSAPALAAEDGPWRAIAASAHETTVSHALSGKKPTEAEAIENARSVCREQAEACNVIATFNAGCRYVALGGRPKGPNNMEPIFLVGLTAEDAMSRCRALGLVCNREPKGWCMDS